MGMTAGAVMAHALPIEIQKGDDGAAQRHGHLRGGRGKRRNHAQQIAQQNQDGDRADHGHVFQARMPGVFLEQVLDAEAQRIGHEHFRDLLEAAWVFDREAWAQPEGQQRAEDRHGRQHDQMFWNRQGRIVRRNAQRLQNLKRQTAEVVINEVSQPAYVMFHLSFSVRACRAFSSYCACRSSIRVPRLLRDLRPRLLRDQFAGCQSSYSVAAIVAAPSAHKPISMLMTGTRKTKKITHTAPPIKA